MTTAETSTIGADVVEALLIGRHGDPFSVLGAHRTGVECVVRTIVPDAETAALVPLAGGEPVPMHRVDQRGLFEVSLPDHPDLYRIDAVRGADKWSVVCPFQFAPMIGAMDEHLISEGTHWRLWDVLGARPVSHGGIDGTAFAVWAPGAKRVSVVGDFNAWDGRRHAMRQRGTTGVWEIFAPGVGPGTIYKYEIVGHDGGLLPLKADPVGFAGELRPSTGSVVAAPAKAPSGAWYDERAARSSPDQPISIYEVHTGSWRRGEDDRFLTWAELAADLVPYASDMGFTHLELLPVSEHPLDMSWGYQPIGLFAPTARHGDGFSDFVAACHDAGLGLILDWVPAHFPSDEHGLGHFDGTALYEHADPREGFHKDWNTLIYNYGRREVANFLIANALYWLKEHGVDGLRVDAVASMLYRDYSREAGEWIPNAHGGRENLEAIEFLRRMNREVYGQVPGIMTIAEESTAWPGVSRPVHEGGLGFGYKWNMGWMNDTLSYIARDPMYRSYHHNQLTFGLLYAFTENFILPISHDEVVHGKGSMFGKMPGYDEHKFANLRAYYAFMFAHPGKKLLFMGQEFGQREEWNSAVSLPWDQAGHGGHRGVQRLIRDLNRLYREQPALYAKDAHGDGFEWLDGSAADAGVLAWIRRGGPDDLPVVVVVNFSGVEHSAWRVGVPSEGFWAEILNSDASHYDGEGRGNMGGRVAEAVPHHGQPHSVALTLPPLSVIWLTPGTS